MSISTVGTICVTFYPDADSTNLLMSEWFHIYYCEYIILTIIYNLTFRLFFKFGYYKLYNEQIQCPFDFWLDCRIYSWKNTMKIEVLFQKA